jgi:hypothetical protein
VKESHGEGLATHGGPESCVVSREAQGEAWTGARTGSVLSREIRHSGALTPLCEAEGNTTVGRKREPTGGPARSKTRCTCGTLLRENRESLHEASCLLVGGEQGLDLATQLAIVAAGLLEECRFEAAVKVLSNERSETESLESSRLFRGGLYERPRHKLFGTSPNALSLYSQLSAMS